MDTARFEAIVIGAGMGGATAAAHLAASRPRLALLEAEASAGDHATGRSDRSLAIGESGARGVFRMVGQGGFGIQTAPAAGRLLANLVEGREPEPALARIIGQVDPRRFA